MNHYNNPVHKRIENNNIIFKALSFINWQKNEKERKPTGYF